jgi:hypothetical protein
MQAVAAPYIFKVILEAVENSCLLGHFAFSFAFLGVKKRRLAFL